jgi:effector-binding domain-containing protein
MDYEIELTDLPGQPAAVVHAHVEPADLPDFLGPAFEEVMATADQQGRVPAGPPFGRYVPHGDGFEVTADFPLDGPVTTAGRVVPDRLPGGTVATTLHTGGYDEVGAAYTATTAWLADEGLAVTGVPWESYLDGPDVPRPRTRVCVPCGPRS